MRESTPEVELIARPSVDLGALERYLKTVGGESWLEMRRSQDEGLNPGQLLVEAAGRACYRSWEPRLNPNVSKVRTDQKEYFLNILRSGHGSVLEHANYTFLLSDVSRVFCYDADTDVLTEEGWKPWPKVDGSELFGTLNPNSGEFEYQRATEHFEAQYEGPMYEVRSEQVDLLVTPNHRMWVQRVDTRAARRKEQPFGIELAEEIYRKQARYQKGAIWKGSKPTVIQIPATHRSWERGGRTVTRNYPGVEFPPRPFARFLGWYLAEGSINRHHIVVYQNRGTRLDRIVETIRGLGLKPYVPEGHQGQVRTYCLPLRDFLADLGTAVDKRIPSIVHEWGPELLKEFLDAMIAGDDSTHGKNGHQVIYTASKEMADDLQVLAIKAGYSANIRVDDRVGLKRVMPSGQEFYNLRPCYIVSFLRGSRLFPHVNSNRRAAPNRWHNDDGFNDRFVHYEGTIHCVKVPNGLLFVRRNGKPVASGNTHELVRHRAGSAFSQESLRFVRLKDIPFRIPESLESLRPQIISILETLEDFQITAAGHFGLDQEGKSFHEKKEITSALRRLAPEGLSTMIIWTANVRTLRHTIQARTDPGAEEEIRYAFDKIGRIMLQEAPLLFGDFTVGEDGAWRTEYKKV
jgi:thymidylate synthase ThyX